MQSVDSHRLTGIAVFQDLSSEAIKALAHIAVAYELESGNPLYQVGDYATQFYVVVSGGIRLVESTVEGKAVNLKIYGPGDVFGLLAFTRDYRHESSAVTIRPTIVLGFNGSEAREVAKHHSDFAVKVIDCLTEHTHHAHDRIRNLAAEKTEKRLAGALLHFHSKFGHEQDGNLIISADLTQRDISEFTGTTLETVNRQLRSWEKAGYIQLSRKRIDILDKQSLQNILNVETTSSGHMPE